MNENQLTTTGTPADVMERLIIHGDLSKLTAGEKTQYYLSVCAALDLNPATQPFAYLKLSGKEVLYARKECTEQLRKKHEVSVSITARESIEGCYVVTARATMDGGRQDESTGAVPIEGLKGEARANAMMKAETKAKRRVTLSICGLGMLDESEIDSIPGVQATATKALPAPKPTKPKKAAPANGQELYARLEAKGREVLLAVVAAGGKAGFPADMTQWNAAQIGYGVGIARDYLLVKPGTPPLVAPAPAPERQPGDDQPDAAELIGPAEVKELNDLRGKVGLAWADCIVWLNRELKAALPADALPAVLSHGQCAALRAALLARVEAGKKRAG